MTEEIIPQQSISLSVPSVDRPDIAKLRYKKTLTSKEVNDCLFKFLMQAGIKFTGPERLSIGGLLHTKTEDIEMSSGGISYRVSCKLDGVTVDNKPIYIIVLATNFLNLESRQKNKITKLKEKFKIIIFDDDDFSALRLDVSGKEWIRPLSRTILKNWARKLFQKLVELKGEIKATFTLNDLYETVDKNTSTKNSKQSVINYLTQEVLQLKKLLIERTLSPNFTIRPEHGKIVEDLISINRESLLWVEHLIVDMLSKINEIDLRKKSFKETFRMKTGEITMVNKDKLCQYVTAEALKHNPHLDGTNYGYGIIEIQNKKTLQSVTISLVPTISDKSLTIDLPVNVVKKLRTPQVFNLVLQFNKQSGKVSRVTGDIFLLGHYVSPFKYDRTHRLPIYDSTIQREYKLVDF